MEVLYILIPVAVLLVLLASGVYIWAVSSGQYDDLDKEGDAILFDDPQKEMRSSVDAGSNDSQSNSIQKLK